MALCNIFLFTVTADTLHAAFALLKNMLPVKLFFFKPVNKKIAAAVYYYL